MNTTKQRKDRQSASEGAKAPVHSLDYPTQGGRVSVACWENTVGENGDQRTVHAVTCRRSYHDGKEWKDTQSFRTIDIPVLIVALQESYRLITEQSKA